MRMTVRALAVAGFFAISAFGLSVAQAADQKQTTNQQQEQHWRYLFYNSEWWYWLPTNQWVYWRGNQWNSYDSRTYTYPQIAGVSSIASNGNGGSYGGGWAYAGAAVDNSDIGPYYGHAISSTPAEIGPYYEYPSPIVSFGSGGLYEANRPFYGHAIAR